jgi:hypothetical protein
MALGVGRAIDGFLSAIRTLILTPRISICTTIPSPTMNFSGIPLPAWQNSPVFAHPFHQES